MCLKVWGFGFRDQGAMSLTSFDGRHTRGSYGFRDITCHKGNQVENERK